jgi:hypothetical protein
MVIDRLGGDDLAAFPIEHARLRTHKYAIAICAPLIAVYGWVLQLKTVWNWSLLPPPFSRVRADSKGLTEIHDNQNMAVPLALQFLIGYTNQVLYTVSPSPRPPPRKKYSTRRRLERRPVS